MKRERKRQIHPVKGKSMTEQHHEKECNINNILARYQKTGLIDHVNKHGAKYGDVTGADFKTAQDLIAEQKTVFYELPSTVRAQFDNDPVNYLELVMTNEGVEQLQTMLNPEPEPELNFEENEAPEPTQDASQTGEQVEQPVT